MTDHTVSPVTEAEMNTFRDIFTRFADTVVNASKLSGEVQTLRSQVEEASRQLSSLTSQNQALVESNDRLRQEVSEARKDRDDVAYRSGQYQVELEGVRKELEGEAARAQTYFNEINVLKRERDDAHYRTLELEDKLKESEARWNKLAEVFGNINAPKALPPQAGPSQGVSPAMGFSQVDPFDPQKQAI